ncbi:6-pyruvoyl tetrahydropterin synthase [Candidatus Bathyarchaeota archaeon ex4484_231]|nr:MAG: 6-pyruvoyl tetrahydropterin synthase [Candidatus Bathyarchaeota archaeon ex4484_231]RJS75636.1 MAG: 6-carboxytetrahydropterin synthase [Candidatus Bathyarchaeota archaeon]
MQTVKIGVEGFTFDSAHYTKGTSEKCLNLHGHTFRLNVEIEGKIDPDTGMVMDFALLKKAVKEVLAEYDHKMLVSERDADDISLSGPFRKNVKVINYPEATTEYLALDIAGKLYEKFNTAVKIKLFEGNRNYVSLTYKKEE